MVKTIKFLWSEKAEDVGSNAKGEIKGISERLNAKRISKRPILNGRGNRKIKGEVTSIKVKRHLADGVKLQENA